jgi:hypothetical protein
MYQVSHWADHSDEPRRARSASRRFKSLLAAKRFASDEVAWAARKCRRAARFSAAGVASCSTAIGGAMDLRAVLIS